MSIPRCERCDRPLSDAAEAATVCSSCAAEAPPRSAKAGKLILALTVIVMIAVAVIMVLQRQPAVRGHADITEGVQITITAPRPTVVHVDGAMVGRTPVVLKLKGGRTRVMKIEGNGVQREITPDRDQIVNLAP